MSPVTDAGPERLSDRQYVVLLLRLLVDADGHIVYGDAGGPEEHNPTLERWVHFRGSDGLLEAVRVWLAARTDLDTGWWKDTNTPGRKRKIMKRPRLIGWLLAGALLVQNAVPGLAAPASTNPLEGRLLEHSNGNFYV